MVNTLDRSTSTLHVYEPTIFNRDFLYYGCFHCLFAPASLPPASLRGMHWYCLLSSKYQKGASGVTVTGWHMESRNSSIKLQLLDYSKLFEL